MIYPAAALWITLTSVIFMFGVLFAYLLITGIMDGIRADKEHKKFVESFKISGPVPKSMWGILIKEKEDAT